MECNNTTVGFRSQRLFLFNLPSGWMHFRNGKLVKSRITTRECRIKRHHTSILFLKNFAVKPSRHKRGRVRWTHRCRGAQNGKDCPQCSADICSYFIVEPLEGLILLLFIHVAKPLYFRFQIACWPVNLAVLLWSLTPPPPLILPSIPLYFHFFPSSLSHFSLPSSSHYLSDSEWSSFPHQSTAERDGATLLYLSVFIQLIFHTLTSNIVTFCSWDNRAEH